MSPNTTTVSFLSPVNTVAFCTNVGFVAGWNLFEAFFERKTAGSLAGPFNAAHV